MHSSHYEASRWSLLATVAILGAFAAVLVAGLAIGVPALRRPPTSAADLYKNDYRRPATVPFPSHSVGQKGRLFSPGGLTVKSGDTVTFKNDDSVVHHIYSSTKGQEFDLPTTKPGQDVQRTFTAKGRVDVRCGLHPGMHLAVTVE